MKIRSKKQTNVARSAHIAEALESRTLFTQVFAGGAGGGYSTASGVIATGWSAQSPQSSSGSVSVTLSNLPTHTAITVSAETPFGYLVYAPNISSSHTRTIIDGAQADEEISSGEDFPSVLVGRLIHTDDSVTIEISVETTNLEWHVEELIVELYTVSLPTVSLSGSGTMSENGTSPVSFTVSRTTEGLGYALPVSLGTAGTASSGDDYDLPPTVVIPAGQTSKVFSVDVIDDAVSESTETVIATLTGNTGRYLVASGSDTATANISDDSGWYYTPWETIGTPVGYADEFITTANEQIGSTSEYAVTTYTKKYEWRYLGVGFTDVSDALGEAADITGRSVTFTNEETTGLGGSLTVSLGNFGLPSWSVGGTYYQEWTTGTGVTVNVTNGQTPATSNALYQVAGYALYAYVERKVTGLVDGNGQPVTGGGSSLFPLVTGRFDLGFTGEISAAFRRRTQHLWLDEEAQGTTSPAAPPAPPSVI